MYPQVGERDWIQATNFYAKLILGAGSPSQSIEGIGGARQAPDADARWVRVDSSQRRGRGMGMGVG